MTDERNSEPQPDPPLNGHDSCQNQGKEGDDLSRILRLRVVGMDWPEIARLLGESVDEIRQRYSKAMLELRESLGIEDEPDEEDTANNQD